MIWGFLDSAGATLDWLLFKWWNSMGESREWTFEGGFVNFLSNTLGLLGSKAIPQFSGTLAQIVILSTADKQDEWEFKGQEEEDGGSLLKRGVGGSSKRSGG